MTSASASASDIYIYISDGILLLSGSNFTWQIISKKMYLSQILALAENWNRSIEIV